MPENVKPTFYITTPIYYVNSSPHIGSAYTTVACDIMARFKELDGYDVKFLTGTDEHGQKIEQSARKAGKGPQEFVDEISEKFVDLVKLMNCEPSTFKYLGRYKRPNFSCHSKLDLESKKNSNEHCKLQDQVQDDKTCTENFSFIRTTNPKHKEIVQKVWSQLEKNGWIYKGKYSGYYCVSDEAYYEESELVKCHDGRFETDLGKEVEWKEEETYFFRLGEFQEILLALYKYYPEFIQPESKRNEVIAFVSGLSIKDFEAGEKPKANYLKNLSISRNNFTWGVPVPGDEQHVMYVWLDALFNYVSALGGLDGEEYKKYWESSDRFLLDMDNFVIKSANGKNKAHIVGKDILRFHAVYWPAFLIGLHYSREKLSEIKKAKETSDKKHYFFYLIAEILELGDIPSLVFAHGWWTNEGKKISKSLGNAVVPAQEIEWLMSEYGVSHETAVDYIRYYIMTEVPFGNDGDYSRDRFVEKINAELVNNIGNLAQRSLSMIYKNCDGKIPNFSCHSEFNSESKKNSKEILNQVRDDKRDTFIKNFENLIIDAKKEMSEFHYEQYANSILSIASFANEYMEHEAPWNLKKEGKIEEMESVLYVVAETVRKIATLLQPFCPISSKRILDQLKVPANKRDFAHLTGEENHLESGVEIEKPEGVFPRLDNRNK